MSDSSEDVLNQMRQQVLKIIETRYATVEAFCWDRDVSKATMSNFFNQRKDFRASTLLKIAAALDMKLIVKLENF